MLSICSRMTDYTPKVALDWDNADNTDSLRARAEDLQEWRAVWREALLKVSSLLHRLFQSLKDNSIQGRMRIH